MTTHTVQDLAISEDPKTQKAVLRWLQKAAAKPNMDRASLTCIEVKDKIAVSSNGYQLHATKVIDEAAGLLDAKTLEPMDADMRYADWRQVIPVSEPAAVISVNPKLLIEALAGFTLPVTLTIRGKDQAIVLQGKYDDQDCFALLMPTYGEDVTKLWTP